MEEKIEWKQVHLENIHYKGRGVFAPVLTQFVAAEKLYYAAFYDL